MLKKSIYNNVRLTLIVEKCLLFTSVKNIFSGVLTFEWGWNTIFLIVSDNLE